VFEFTYRFINLGRAYFGKLDEESVKNNFVYVPPTRPDSLDCLLEGLIEVEEKSLISRFRFVSSFSRLIYELLDGEFAVENSIT